MRSYFSKYLRFEGILNTKCARKTMHKNLVLILILLLFVGCTDTPKTPQEKSTPVVDPEVRAQIEAKTAEMKSSLLERGTISPFDREDMRQKAEIGTMEREGEFKPLLFPTAGHVGIKLRPPTTLLVFSEDFSSSKGPALKVGLIKAKDVKDYPDAIAKNLQEVYGLIDLEGYQEYDLAGLDHTDYMAVVLYSDEVRQIWGFAPLGKA